MSKQRCKGCRYEYPEYAFHKDPQRSRCEYCHDEWWSTAGILVGAGLVLVGVLVWQLCLIS